MPRRASGFTLGGTAMRAPALLLLALLAAPAARAQEASAHALMPGCRELLGPRVADGFAAGRCLGLVTAVAALAPEVCPPPGATQVDAVRLVASHADARPDRLHENFLALAREALSRGWPCR